MTNLKSDQHHIRQIIAMMQLAWNNHDAYTLFHDFDANAEFITITGQLLKGRKQIFNCYASLLRHRYREVMISLSHPVINFLNTEAAFGYAEVELKHQPRGFAPCNTDPTYALLVLIKRDQQWKVVQGRHYPPE